MGLTAAVRTVLGKYATFEGRAPRSEYWWWQLFVVLLILGLAGLATVAAWVQPVAGLVYLLLLLPNLAVAVRRLHDTGRSGWYLLVGLIPIVGALLLLWWYVKRGTVGPNRFGPDPL